jgi:hypothetical protein
VKRELNRFQHIWKIGLIGISVIALMACMKIGDADTTMDTVEIGTVFNMKDNIELSMENYNLVKKNESSRKVLTLSEDFIITYDIFDKDEVIGNIELTLRKLDNQDVFVFTKLLNYEGTPLTANLKIKLDDVNRFVLDDWDKRYKEHVHNGTTGVDPTTYPIGLVEAYSFENLKHSIVLSKNYISRELSKEYDNNEESILRELISEEKAFSTMQLNDSIEITLPLQSQGNDISENWVLFSNERLFENEENLTKWVNYHIDSYSQANKWLTAEGPYKKLPWSIEPSTKMGYGRNLGIMQDKRALDSYEAYGERYFYNLVVNSISDLFVYKEVKGTEIWETEYTSTWLKKPYGTTAPYIDTRHNENIAIFLTRAARLLNIEELQKAQTIYGDYLVDQVQQGNTIEIGDGYLVADYFSPYDSNKTHASMNHIIGGINFLLDCYAITNDPKYLEVASNIRAGVEGLGEKWIRDTGDLWYQVNPDLTFAGNDYEQLTLIDLLTTQQKWEDVGQQRSELFDKFIQSKTEYLVREKKEIYGYVINTLIDQGFEKALTGEYIK